MKTNLAKQIFHGTDWATERPVLAQALTTLDDMYTLSLGFTPDAAAGETDDSDLLQAIAELVRVALNDLDLLAADLMPVLSQSPQAGWSTFEARELLGDLSMLCAEARQSMRYMGRDELPRALAFEMGYLTGRVKELLKAIDSAA